MDKFLDIVNNEGEIEGKRAKLERTIFYLVLVFIIAGVGYAVAAPSVIESIVYWFTPAGGNDPVIINAMAFSGNNLSAQSTDAYPTFNNTFVRFNVSFNDTDLQDWHGLIVCNGTAGNYTFSSNESSFNFTCGSNEELCRYSDGVYVTDNPLDCDTYAYGYANQTQNFTAYIIDNSGRLDNYSGVFVVDRPPIITNISVVIL